MLKRYGLLLLTIVLIAIFAASCSNATTSTSVGGSVLETGYAINEGAEIVSPVTTFKANEDFYFSFYNNEPFGDNVVTIKLTNSDTDEVLLDSVLNVDPTWVTYANTVSFVNPGKYNISITVGDQLRATQEVIIE